MPVSQSSELRLRQPYFSVAYVEKVIFCSPIVWFKCSDLGFCVCDDSVMVVVAVGAGNFPVALLVAAGRFHYFKVSVLLHALFFAVASWRLSNQVLQALRRVNRTWDFLRETQSLSSRPAGLGRSAPGVHTNKLPGGPQGHTPPSKATGRVSGCRNGAWGRRVLGVSSSAPSVLCWAASDLKEHLVKVLEKEAVSL